MTAKTMIIGLSSYAFFWQASDRVERPLGLPEMIDADGGARRGRVPDLRLPGGGRADGGAAARAARPGRAGRDPAGARHPWPGPGAPDALPGPGRRLDVVLVRSMLYTATTGLPRPRRRTCCAQALPDYERAGVTLGPGDLRAGPDRRTGRPGRRGRQPQPRRLPRPGQLRRRPRTAHRRRSTRSRPMWPTCTSRTSPSPGRTAGWASPWSAAPLGEGLLDYPAMVERCDPQSRGISQVIEHWLPWQGNPEATCDREPLDPTQP